MSDAADRRIAELEKECARLLGTLELTSRMSNSANRNYENLWERFQDLEKKLVERDVYEAQQILPPEQAALIKHLTTVERCIDAAEDYGDYDASNCLMCDGDRHYGHYKTCAWLALQFDRKPAETMAMVEDWAVEENNRRDRERARAMTPQRPGRTSLAAMSQLLKDLYPESRVQDVTPGSPGMRGHFNVMPHPLVPPGHAYLISGLGEPERFAVAPSDVTFDANPATVAPDEAPQHPGLEGEPRRARGGEDLEEREPAVDYRSVDRQR